MKKEDLSPVTPSHVDPVSVPEDDVEGQWRRVVRRRAFLKVGAGVAAAAIPAGGLLATDAMAAGSTLTKGDAAILRFLAAAEIIETDLWQQYNELGGISGGNAAYIAALSNLDGDMPQYIADNTDDEMSHVAFLNAYLKSRGAEPVNLDRFRTLPSSKATGAKQTGRLTNLQKLDVDTSWYTRYRSDQNPDFGARFPQAVDIRKEPAIPLTDADTPPAQPQPNPPTTPQQRRMQAIANTAGFHFAYIEQGGASLYTALSLKASDVEVLRIIVSIGGVEVDHFAVWHDKAGNAVNQPLAGVTDPETGVNFPDLNARNSELFQTNLIFPEPAQFIRRNLPVCSVIRPSSIEDGGAVATIKSFTADLLFLGQSQEFFDTVMDLARAADAARREL
jgi:Ferritin-like domain